MNRKCNHGYKNESGDCYSCILIKKQLEDPVLLKKRKEEAGIKKKFFDVDFDGFFKQCKHVELKNIGEEMLRYDLKHNILMIGNTGTFKTYLAVATLINAIKSGFTGYYAKFYELTQMQIHDNAKFNKMCNVDLLVIDEFGIGKSDYKSELLFQIIDTRYDNEQPTIIISNKGKEEVKNCMTDATYSRIVENREAYSFDFTDSRVKD